jgi:hypothetical protein
MKKFILLIVLFTILSCQKTEIQPSQPTKFNYRTSQTSVYNLMYNPDNASDEQVNFVMYDWAIEVRTLISNQSSYNSILNSLINDADHTISFQDLQINVQTTEFTYEGITYEPYLWLFNPSTLNSESQPYLCIGTDIDPELALGNDYSVDDELGDFISGWKFNEDVYLDEVLNEDDALVMSEPLLIITFAEQGEPVNNTMTKRTEVNHPIDPAPDLKRYWVTSFNIDERFDRSRR